MALRGNNGIGKLATALDRRMGEHADYKYLPDFGEIRSDLSLVMNTFPVPIPKTDYSVCGSLCGLSIEGGKHSGHSGGNDGSHGHALRKLSPGDRVLVVWADEEPVVIDIIMKASSI